jgi:hypothetical protein
MPEDYEHERARSIAEVAGSNASQLGILDKTNAVSGAEKKPTNVRDAFPGPDRYSCSPQPDTFDVPFFQLAGIYD